MKKYIIAVFLLSGLFLSSQAQEKAILEGVVPNWENDGFLLLIDGQKLDTLGVADDGQFRYEILCNQGIERELYLEYLGDDRCVIPCYLRPGKTTAVKVKGEMKDGRLACSPEYAGDNRKECEYLYATKDYWLGFSPNYVKPDNSIITFKEYKEQVENFQQKLRGLLKGVSKDFATVKEKEIEALPEVVYFPYAWNAKRNQVDASKDPDFVAYMTTIDLNDPENVSVIDQYVRFSMEGQTSDEDSNIRYFKAVKEKISSQEVRNILADERMSMYFAIGGEGDMTAVFEAYKKVSTNKEAIAENQALYDRLSKLVPGVKASDFEMQTVDGKTIRFHDVIGQGKVTYIDFWATWCGPCCAEIPYVEKLVEKYKNNPNIEFVSISLDKDLDKWHKKLDHDQPAWKQYIIPDNFNSTFAKEYNITAIPRFMLFDKEGKIISINADRPSSEGIEEYLNQYLN